jgi:xylulose-5-phosphate/fructose-6-phosphate phosphoketolase
MPIASKPKPASRTRARTTRSPTGASRLGLLDAYWRAANYLSVGQIYLLDNPLLRRPLTLADVKPRLLGHWGTTPGLNFIYAHANRAIVDHDLDMLFVCGPGHGGPGVVANVYLEGTYTEVYPHVTRDEAGLTRLVRQFSFPGGIPSHVAPETPGSIHEGGELGYSLAHAYGAVLDAPDAIALCVVGDGEAETGPLATSWHANKFVNPRSDGAVLPVLHLNGAKIAGPTLLARLPHAELDALLRGYGHVPLYVEGSDPRLMHRAMARAFDLAVARIRALQLRARKGKGGRVERALWPMIVLRSPKGWTGPKTFEGKRVEGTFRAHQVPIPDVHDHPERLPLLERWLKSYRPAELFDQGGALAPELAALAPRGERRMGAQPRANGGLLLKGLVLPDLADHAVAVPAPGARDGEATRVQGAYLRDVLAANRAARNFRLFSPDETASNRWNAVFEETGRRWMLPTGPGDEDLSPDGRVFEILSEHLCQGWLEGYLLSGRHGMFSCYEAFIHIVDSMFNQHAKWLKVARTLPWRRPIASLNILLSSHVWRQDHNGFSHQDPGFLDHVVNKKADVIRVYLPPDANTLLCVTEHCLKSRNYVNVIVAGKQPAPQWLGMEAAQRHCQAGIGTWDWASNDEGAPDVVLACAGDVPTLETLAAVDLLRTHLPDLRVRVVNVVDLMTLQPEEEHPHGLSDTAYDALFPPAVPTVFAFHGYPTLIHRLTYRRAHHPRLHVRGYKEEGTTTTPFDMVVRNDLDRFRLVLDVIRRTGRTDDAARALETDMRARRKQHHAYIVVHGDDPPAIRDWRWEGGA